MELHLIRHLWGVDEPWQAVFPRIRAEGFRGIETGLPREQQRDEFRALLDAHAFDYIAQIFTQGASAPEHLESFRAQLTAAAGLNPRLVNCHSGLDAWTEAESAQFFEQALAFEAEMGVPVAHETHRGRILYNPWITARMLAQFGSLKLCCDFSHWVCVCERLIDDQLAIIDECAARCLHIHARVGYEQGPQVPDPRAPEYAPHLEAHERWWARIWLAQRARGMAASTLTPEYGPPAYLHTLPHTAMPVADLWAICHWQAQRALVQFASSQG